jgi:hypothetical protein
MPSQITLDTNEKTKVKIAILTSSNKIYYVASARIYHWNRKWSYDVEGIQSALVLSIWIGPAT